MKQCPYHRSPCLKDECWAYVFHHEREIEWDLYFHVEKSIGEYPVCLALHKLRLGKTEYYDGSIRCSVCGKTLLEGAGITTTHPVYCKECYDSPKQSKNGEKDV